MHLAKKAREIPAFEQAAVETFTYRSAKAGTILAEMRNSTRTDRLNYSREVIADAKDLASYIVAKGLSKKRLAR
jgi:hypothetical protein